MMSFHKATHGLPIKPAAISNAGVSQSCSRVSKMSFYAPSDARCVSPASGAIRFDTALRKNASGNIFENLNRDVLVKLFEKAGDPKATERAEIILAHHQEPEGVSKALMALPKDKKDKLVLITGLMLQSFKWR